jgi:hypothetical protein
MCRLLKGVPVLRVAFWGRLILSHQVEWEGERMKIPLNEREKG